MSSYRIVRVGHVNYKDAVNAAYREDPGLANLPYIEQQRRIFALALVYSDSFSRGMRDLGHDAHEILYDVEPLQRAWARENGVVLDEKNWEQIVLHRQIATLQPEILYCQDIHSTPYRLRRSLRALVRSIRLVVVHKGFPGAFDELGDVDLLMLAVPSLVRIYRERGLQCELVYHGFNDRVPELLNDKKSDDERHAFTFLGSSGYGNSTAQRERYWALMRLMRNTPITPFINEPFVRPLGPLDSAAQLLVSNLGSSSRSIKWGLNSLPKRGPTRRLRQALQDVVSHEVWRRKPDEELGGEDVPPVPLCRVFPERCREAVYGLDMYRTLQASDVTFNLHTNGAYGDVGNMRMYEATGVGACLLTDTGNNMADLYDVDREVVIYKSYPELLEKFEYLRDHPDERRKIAEAGRQRTLRDHTVRRRVDQIDELIQRKLRDAPRSR